MSYVPAEPPYGDFRQPQDAVVVLRSGRLLDVTTYEEWRVTGTWGTGPYAFTWGRGYSDPGAEARNFVRAAQEPGPWTDGPHLHKRTVTVTDWTEELVQRAEEHTEVCR